MTNLINYRFSRDDLTLKPGPVSGQNALCLVYADTRAYQDALDSFGIMWGTTVQAVGPKAAIVALTIDGVTRSASGEDTDLMSAEARAFKRACSAFGLGRYIYSIDLGFQPFDGKRFGQAAHNALDKALRAMHTQQHAPQPAQGKQATPTPESPQEAAAHVEGDAGEGGTEPWYVVARRNLTNGTALLADKMLAMHRTGDGQCTDKQYQFLSGLIDSLPGVGDDGHNKVLSIICQSEISSNNRPSFDLATKLLDYLPTHTKVDGVKVENPNYRADVVEHISKIANALQMQLLAA